MISSDTIFVRYVGDEALADLVERKLYIKTKWVQKERSLAALFDRSPLENAVTGAHSNELCDGGEMVGCSNLGVAFHKGEGVPKDYKRAVALYRKACDGGEMLGCRNHGVMYHDGKGVKKDEERAAKLCQQVCDGGEET